MILAVQRTGRLGALGWGPPERPTVATAQPLTVPPNELGLIPEPAWLVRQGPAIGLSPAQQQQAVALAAAWDRDTAQTRAALAQAGGEVTTYLQSRQAAGQFEQSAAQQRSQRLSALSAELSARRHDAWDRVWSTLTAAQRERVKQLRGRAPLEMR